MKKDLITADINAFPLVTLPNVKYHSAPYTFHSLDKSDSSMSLLKQLKLYTETQTDFMPLIYRDSSGTFVDTCHVIGFNFYSDSERFMAELVIKTQYTHEIIPINSVYLRDMQKSFEYKVVSLFLDVVKRFSLPADTFVMFNHYSDSGKNAGSFISTEIQIQEFSYPYDDANPVSKSTHALYIKPVKDGYELLIRRDRMPHISLPATAQCKTCSDRLYQHVFFSFDDVSVYSCIRDDLIYCLKHYDSSHRFGCCSRYQQCLEQQRCLHSNLLYARGCQYRKLKQLDNFSVPEKTIATPEQKNRFSAINDSPVSRDEALSVYDFVTVDFETANNDMNSACSIGIACVKNLEIVAEEYFLIKPPVNYFDKKNIEVHHITYADVRNADTFDVLWPKISHYFDKKCYIIAHNASFDMSVLNECLETYNIPKPDFDYVDSIGFSSKVCSGCDRSLVARCAYFGIDIEDHHNALSDAIMCAQIIIQSVNASKYSNFLTYLKRYSSIRIYSFSDIRPRKKMRKEKFHSVNISEIRPNTTLINPFNPFFEKNCVFTGELQTYERADAMQRIVDLGGIIKSNVSRKTDFLIVGTQDLNLVAPDGLSTKERRAHELNASGCNIHIVYEKEFLNLLRSDVL